MKQFLIILIVVLLSSCKDTPTTVHLKGQLDGMGPVVIMSHDGAASMLGDSRNIIIHTDAQGFFDTIIPLANPEYYSIRRNTLYLTPGDDMEIYINEINTEARFTGKGAEINDYMKYRLFPKGGSFLEAGSNLKDDLTSTKAYIDSAAAARLLQLENLKNASPEFKQMEEARVYADIINSYLSYTSYERRIHKDQYAAMSKEEVTEKNAAIQNQLISLVQPILKQIIDEKYIDVAVVRDVLSMSDNNSTSVFFEGINLPERTKELYEAARYIFKLRNEAILTVVNESKAYAESMVNEDFKTEVFGKIKQASKLLPGSPSVDINMEDRAGKVSKLRDYKGKVIYADFWATWCGPCIAESPIFNALSKKYVGKDIVFLQISTDNHRRDWEKFIEKKAADVPQYISKDPRLKNEWGILYIPRFVLIDKNFNIIDAYAALPSDSNIEKVLNDALNL